MRSLLVLSLLAITSCSGPSRDDSASSPGPSESPAPLIQTSVETRILTYAPHRFRPGGWSDERTIWGLVRGRVTRFDIVTGQSSTRPETAWWIQAAPDVVTWRNENGIWIQRGSKEPVRLSEATPLGPDGIATVLWSSDGRRAILGWQHEWDARYELLEENGLRRPIDVNLPGYYGNGAARWLDSTRVLFQTVATGPIGGKPAYRESGWRGDLAVLDLHTGSYSRVTSVPDSTFLHVIGWYGEGILVREWRGATPRRSWLYDPLTWNRRPVSIRDGPAFSSQAGALVVLTGADGDSSEAVVVSGNGPKVLGRVARDAVPAFSPSGRRGLVATARGSMLFEVTRVSTGP